MATAVETKESVKETLISILIAFVLAFVARSFVAEAFIIPTGSMAPTLLGAHMTFTNPQTGATWTVGPWVYEPGHPQEETSSFPEAVQRGAGGGPVVVHDPLTGEEVSRREVPCRAGDRIMVLKYLYALCEPERFDVVVFKNPEKPGVNYIKRLIGLPSEQVALIDGDVFARPGPQDAVKAGPDSWNEPGWKIQRKPLRVQRAVWQPVYDSQHVPADPATTSASVFSPWDAQGAGWQPELAGRSFVYRGTGEAPGVLRWNAGAEFIREGGREVRRARDVVDRYSYNEGQGVTMFPVSDVRLIAGAQPIDAATADKVRVTALLQARAHQFRAVVEKGTATIQRRPAPSTSQPDPAWETLDNKPAPTFSADRILTVDFWHCDQALHLFIDDVEVCSAEYDWTPAERIRFATKSEIATIVAGSAPNTAPRASNPFADPSLYTPPSIQWQVAGGAVRLLHLGVQRDIHYQPGLIPPSYNRPARGTHPSETVSLASNQFFVCGDNSPQSHDSRMWFKRDPWVSQELDRTEGVVPRRMMLGKAFFVYFPALVGDDPIPVPDFGRMRFIQ